MENNVYMKEGLDLKRLVLVIGKKFWLVALGIVVGGLLGGIVYKTVTGFTNGTPEYRASADYYITFNFDEFEHGDDYYNAYTWDGILRDDPIVDYALTVLPDKITKEMVKESVSGEMLGDYRILTVHVTCEDQETTDLIAKAYQESLVHFGQEIELLEKVEVWSQEEASLMEKNTKTINAMFLGSLLSGLLVLFLLLFYYVLEGSVYVEKDAKDRLGLPVLGIESRKKDEKLKQMLENNLSYIFRGEEITRWKAEVIPSAQDYEVLRNAQHLVIEVMWGQNNLRQILRVLEQMQLQDCKVKGIIITEAEDAFLKAYYGKNAFEK